MDNLTGQKKLNLIHACINAQEEISKRHFDIRKMYAYLSDQACNATTAKEIACLEVAKTSLDFLVKRVLK